MPTSDKGLIVLSGDAGGGGLPASSKSIENDVELFITEAANNLAEIKIVSLNSININAADWEDGSRFIITSKSDNLTCQLKQLGFNSAVVINGEESVLFDNLQIGKYGASFTCFVSGQVNKDLTIISNSNDRFSLLPFPSVDVVGVVGSNNTDSVNLLVLDTSLTELQRQVTVIGTADPTVSVNMVHVDVAKLAGSVSLGSLMSVNTVNGTFNILENISFIETYGFAKCRFAASDNIVIGIGIGDPTDLPSMAGSTTAGGTYVSRFVDDNRGEGASRDVTFQLPYFPVGKTSTNAAAQGDELFIVAWTEETDNSVVTFEDMIITIKAFN